MRRGHYGQVSQFIHSLRRRRPDAVAWAIEIGVNAPGLAVPLDQLAYAAPTAYRQYQRQYAANEVARWMSATPSGRLVSRRR